MTPQVNAVSVLSKFCPKPITRKKLASARAAHQKHDYPTPENQPKSLINEAICLTSIDDSSIKLTRSGEPNYHRKRWALTKKVDKTVSFFPVDLYPRPKSLNPADKKWRSKLSSQEMDIDQESG